MQGTPSAGLSHLTRIERELIGLAVVFAILVAVAVVFGRWA